MSNAHFKIFLLSSEFYKICDWKIYKISITDNRPVLLLVIEDQKYPDSLCCVPLTKDDDKNDKYKNLSEKSPDLVHSINVNHYDSYLLIQNMFYVRKEFIGRPYTVNGVEYEIKNENLQKDILKKVRKINALINKGKLNFVPREIVYQLQNEYLERLKKNTSNEK